MNLRDPRIQKMLLIVMLAGGVVYAYFGLSALPFGYKARASEIKELKVDYAKISADLSQARRLAADLPRVEMAYDLIHKRWEAANTLLPDQSELAGLLRKVTLAGQSSGVEFYLFRPQAPVQNAFYFENPIQVRVVGGYHQTGSFLGELASLPRLVNVSDLKLASFAGGQEDNTVEASFTATAYSVAQNTQPPEIGDGRAARPRSSTRAQRASQAVETEE